MVRQIIINRWFGKARGAVIENGKTSEWLFDGNQHVPGTIIKGKVADVLPGMDAAFVDIGSGKNGFLYKKELAGYHNDDMQTVPVNSLVTKGQSIIVQVKKEEAGTKGAKLSEQLSFPGKYIVYLPYGRYAAVSKKMRDEETRTEWRSKVKEWLAEDEGIIIRTLAQNVTAERVHAELDALRNIYKKVMRDAERSASGPTVLYNDATVLSRVARDFITDSRTDIVVDDVNDYRTLASMLPEHEQHRVTLYQGKEDILSSYGLAKAMEKSLTPFIWLKNGGSLHINFTEAMTVIDVNSARFTGKQGIKDTALKTNVEAAKAIAHELRLREIGGMILIDFIEMPDESDRTEVLDVLNSTLKHDRTITNVLGFTKLGLVEMTRKKTRQSLHETMMTDCRCCNGTGRQMKADELANEAERVLYAKQSSEDEAVLLELNERIMPVFLENNKKRLHRLEEICGQTFYLTSGSEKGFHIRFSGSKDEVRSRWEQREKARFS